MFELSAQFSMLSVFVSVPVDLVLTALFLLLSAVLVLPVLWTLQMLQRSIYLATAVLGR